jgi:hypothetical protein
VGLGKDDRALVLGGNISGGAHGTEEKHERNGLALNSQRKTSERRSEPKLGHAIRLSDNHRIKRKKDKILPVLTVHTRPKIK